MSFRADVLAIVLLFIDPLARVIELLVEFLQFLGGQFPVGLHTRSVLFDLCFPSLEPSGLLGGELAAVDPLVDPLLLILHALLDPGIIRSIRLGLSQRQYPRTEEWPFLR
jgi:hypothetical protein